MRTARLRTVQGGGGVLTWPGGGQVLWPGRGRCCDLARGRCCDLGRGRCCPLLPLPARSQHLHPPLTMWPIPWCICCNTSPQYYRMTDACKNITFTCFATWAVKNLEGLPHQCWHMMAGFWSTYGGLVDGMLLTAWFTKPPAEQFMNATTPRGCSPIHGFKPFRNSTSGNCEMARNCEANSFVNIALLLECFLLSE